MNRAENLTEETLSGALNEQVSITPATEGKPLEIGGGFKAKSFREKEFAGAMDPLVMVDHYTMVEPTFGAHPHAGLSAVSLLFEDTEGKFHNRDTLGNDFDLLPGDLYWLKAGSGVVHDESPRNGSKIHGLQVFVNLPARLKSSSPEALHVKANKVPVIQETGARVRVMLGESNGVKSEDSPALPMTILDGSLTSGSSFSHRLNAGESAWLYAVSGSLELRVSDCSVTLPSGQALAIGNQSASLGSTIELANQSSSDIKFVLFSAEPVKEEFVQKGPFVMSTERDIEQIEADYAAGKLGKLS
ncbi:MAG: pirin family protein [Pseudomonadota bacterium]